MRIVFMGTPKFAADILEPLAEQHEVICVYTRADAVRSRGSKLMPSEVKERALGLGIPVRTPTSLRDESEIERLSGLAPDIIVVAAYGMILPKGVLDIPAHGCINVHASLLPEYRGAAPINRAILDGKAEAGVSIMRMEEGLDTGDFCVSRSIEIGDMDATKLTDELADLGARALLTSLMAIEAGSVRWMSQDESSATYAHKISKEELALCPDDGVSIGLRKVRASDQGHPCRCMIAGKGVTIIEASLAEHEPLEAGYVCMAAKRLLIGFADGVLALDVVKPDGKKEMPGAAFAQGIQGIKAGNIQWQRI